MPIKKLNIKLGSPVTPMVAEFPLDESIIPEDPPVETTEKDIHRKKAKTGPMITCFIKSVHH